MDIVRRKLLLVTITGDHSHSSRGEQRFTVCGGDGHFFVLFILKLMIFLNL